MLLNPTSLMKTVDAVNEKALFNERISKDEGHEVARWIITREGQKGAYRNMFAPTQQDFDDGIRLFTGERLVSASARHILGQEAARALMILDNKDTIVKAAYDRTTSWMHENQEFQHSGTFCCGRCTLAFWRNYLVGDFADKEPFLNRGLQVLKYYRIGNGQWQRFPFFYAIYTLLEIDLDAARSELKYAQPLMDKYLKKSSTGNFHNRRKLIIEKALEKIN